MRKRMLLGATGVLILVVSWGPVTAQARIDKRTVSCDSGYSWVECRKVITDPSEGEWLRPSHAYQFRTTNGRSCNIEGRLTRARNADMNYANCYMNRNGSWCEPGLKFEQDDDGPWSYEFDWRMECN